MPFALVTTWRVWENKLATRVNLEKRGVAVEALCVVFVGWRRSQIAICSSSAAFVG